MLASLCNALDAAASAAQSAGFNVHHVAFVLPAMILLAYLGAGLLAAFRSLNR
jgi:hypothetical protein